MADDESLHNRMFRAFGIELMENANNLAKVGVVADADTLVAMTAKALIKVCADEIEKAQLRIAKLELNEARREDYEMEQSEHE
jgi:hypothetical protein